MRLKTWCSLIAVSAAASGQAFAVDAPEKVTFTKLGTSSHRFDWVGKDGWTCFPQYSVDMKTWLYIPEIDQGVIHDPIDVCPLDEDENIYPRCFFRLEMSDFPTLDPKGADFDGDGASNWLEITGLGTSPLKADSDNDGFPDGQSDTDGDGIADQWEMMLIEQNGPAGTTGVSAILPGDDFDHDGVSNYQEYQRGFNGYQKDSDSDGYSDRLAVDQESNLRMDESTGTVVKDDSGQNRNGVLVASAGWQPTGGISGGALEFHGGNDAVEMPADIFNNKTNLTVSLWFKTSSTSSSQTLLSSASTAHSPELAVSLESGGTLRFDSGGGLSATWIFGRSLADGLWHHLAITRDMTAQTATLYLDGKTVGTPQTVLLSALAVDAVTLGQRHQSVSTYQSNAVFTGLLDEVRVYSAVLEPSHLKELFQANDLDQDGLPDDYEMSLFQNLATLAGAEDDLDEDGLTNRQEYEGGTSPDDYYNGQTPVISLFSGSGQTIYNGQRTRLPIIFLITDGTNPLVNAPVDLSQLQLIGGFETLDGDTFASSLTLKSDSEGKVAVHFKAD